MYPNPKLLHLIHLIIVGSHWYVVTQMRYEFICNIITTGYEIIEM